MKSTTANLANSDGWSRNGPRSIQRADPAVTVPMPRTSTASSIPPVARRNGTATRRQSCTLQCDATTNVTAPQPIHSPWCSTSDQGEPVVAMDSTDEDESTITRPRTQKLTMRAVSAAASRRAAVSVAAGAFAPPRPVPDDRSPDRRQGAAGPAPRGRGAELASWRGAR